MVSSNVQVKIKRSILKADKMSFKLHGNIVGAIKNIVKRKKFNLVIFQLDDIGLFYRLEFEDWCIMMEKMSYVFI